MQEQTVTEETTDTKNELTKEELLQNAVTIKRLRKNYIAETNSSKEGYKAAIYFGMIDKGLSLNNKIPKSEAQEKELWAWFSNKLSKRRAKNKVARASRKRNR